MPAKILIIEDHDATAKMICDVLAINGLTSILAADGLAGIGKAREENPDLILLDIMLPGINGFEVCEKLKEDISTSNIPIIIVSVREEQSYKEKGLELGCIDYFVKPFEVNELVEAIKKGLENRQMDQPNNSRQKSIT